MLCKMWVTLCVVLAGAMKRMSHKGEATCYGMGCTSLFAEGLHSLYGSSVKKSDHSAGFMYSVTRKK